MPSLKIHGRQAATTLEPATAGAHRVGSAPSEERVLTFGDVFGRDAGGLIVLLILFGALTLGSDEFLTGDNMANLARQVAVFGIIAVGQLLVILTAGIDLSVGSVLGLTGCITAELLVHGMGDRAGDPRRHGRRRRASASSTARSSPTASCRRSSSRSACSASRAAWCSCSPTRARSSRCPTRSATSPTARSSGCRTCCGCSSPSSLIAAFVLRRTVFGRYVYAVGSNPESARLAGVPVTRVLVSVYAIAGLLAAVGGVLFTSRLNAGIPTAGTGLRAQRDRRVRHRRGAACSAPRAGRSAPRPARSSSARSTTAATCWPSTRSTCRSSSAC